MKTRRNYRLLDVFERLFSGVLYRHRSSPQGDSVALQLYEDLYRLGKSTKLKERIDGADWVVNIQNKRHGIKARRGDGTFGEKVPEDTAIQIPGFVVARAKLATVEIGVEVKILAKAMIKQIDRVINDLRGQVEQFRRGRGDPLSVGIVAINHADSYTSMEKDRVFATDGRHYPHPIQEAGKAEARLRERAELQFEHFLILRFIATNVEPFPFAWVDPNGVVDDYAAMLTRISRDYDRRFRNNGHEGQAR